MNRLSLAAIALVLLVILGVWYAQGKNLEVNGNNSGGAIFTVATSTGATYLTVTADGNVGVGTSDPTATLEVAGPIRLTKPSAGCDVSAEGEIAYNPGNKHFWGCDGAEWHQLDN